MARVVHFEIPASDPQRAVEFYREAFGWKIERWEGPIDYWLITTGEPDEPGIDGAITPQTGGLTTVNTVGVVDLDASVGKVVAAGGRVVQSRTAIPGIGWLAYCSDPDGNVFGLMQADVSAA